MHNCKFIVFVLLCAVMLLGLPCCACQPVRDAQQTVAVADSLRVNEGATYDDSLALAEAYSTLGHWRLIYPNAFTRACYDYGRMLRDRNDQVAAMRAFISGTHAPFVQRVVPLPWFTDYHILGRIYSNMGTMCHLADEFELSYDMYERTATCMLQSNDSILYYYALNAMAAELAEQNLYRETLTILKRIEAECTDAKVLTKMWETKAILYRNLTKSDSAIYAAKQLYSRSHYTATTGYVIEAQSFWQLEQYDSALYYAKLVIDHIEAVEQDLYNMLYLVAYCDSAIGKNDMQKYYQERADIDKGFLDPLHEQLAQAIIILEQEINAPVNYSLFIIIGCSIMLVLASMIVHRQHNTSIAHIQEEEHILSIKELNLSTKEQELSAKDRILHEEQAAHRDKLIKEVEHTCQSLRMKSNLLTKQGMKDYAAVKKLVNKRLNMLVDKLEATNALTEQKIKFCILVLLKVPQKQIAKILTYSERSIGNTKTLIAQDLKTTSAELRNILIDICLQ